MRSEKDLHDYQNTAVSHILDHTHCALFLEMGLGKTVSTLTAINLLMYGDLSIEKVLVIAPKRVAENVWTSETQKWAHLKHLKISRVAGNPKQRLTALKTKADIYTISRDNVAWLCGQYGGSMLPFDMVVIDESSSFKNHQSQRFKALKKVQASLKRVLALTGTPSPNSLIDLWAQMYLLDRGERLGKTISIYREDYFKPGKRNGMVVFNYDIQKGAEERIHEKLKDICVSMKAEDYLKLPKVIQNDIEIILPPEVRKQYDKFERDLVLEIVQKEEPITAQNATSLSMKLRQFANGAVYDSEKIWHEVHTLKLEALTELVEAACGNPVFVAYEFKHDLARIMGHLKAYNPVKLDTEQDIADWNAGKIQVMVAHPASVGHGLNLQDGGNIITWFGNNYSLELYQQFNARLNRQGQVKPVIINRLICKGTEDENVVASLHNKTNTQDALMAGLKARLKKYGINFK